MNDLNLRFLPWLRRGLARAANTGALDAFATIDVQFDVGGETVSQSLRLRGPGDIIGIDPAQVIRAEPKAGTLDFEPNYFPCIEFSMPDLPWMFTPAAPAGDKLLPWLTLVTVDDSVASIGPAGNAPLPVLRTPPSELPPDLSEMWAWAHVQTTSLYAAGGLNEALRDEPQAFISRILSPRNLQAGRAYTACLVPTYKAGVLAGLGLPVGDDVGQTLAWSPDESADEIELPVYYSWSFRTGPMGDFETLVERLQPLEFDETVGRRRMDLTHMGVTLPGQMPDTTFFFGALVAPAAIADEDLPDRNQPMRETFFAFIAPGDVEDPAGGAYDYREDDPVVTPPHYGREQLSGADLPPPKPPKRTNTRPYEPVWYGDVNTHPRTRGVAGLGMRAVRRHQEEFMAEAWREVTALRAINQTLQQAALASLVAGRWRERVVQLDSGARLSVTRSAHERVRVAAGGQTVWGQLREAPVPDGAFSIAHQRTLRTGSVIHHSMRLVDRTGPILHTVQKDTVDHPARLSAQLEHTPPAGMQTEASVQKGDASDPDVLASPLWPLADIVGRLARNLDGLLARGGEIPRDETAGVMLDVHRVARGHVAQVDALTGVGGSSGEQVRISRYTASSLAGEADKLIDDFAGDRTPGRKQLTVIRDQVIAWEGDLRELGRIERPVPTSPGEPGPDADETLEPIAAALSGALVPIDTIHAHLIERIDIGDRAWGARPIPSRFTAHLSFGMLIYPYISEQSPEYMLPGVGAIEENTVGLVQVNAEFVEAALIGVNHEMSREMRWREYPAPLYSTWFKHFWSAMTPDIGEIGGWKPGSALGEHLIGAAAGGTLVLLIKGEILRRYPNLALYAVKADVVDIKDDSGQKLRVRVAAEPEQQVYPAFSGELANGVQFFGFDPDELSIPDVLGDPNPQSTSADGGWFFVLQEQPTEPRFGLDEYEAGARYNPNRLGTWSELSWGHFMPGDDPDAPAYLPLGEKFGGVALPDTTEPDTPTTTWGSSAGAMARIVLQRPVRMLVHASAMLPEGT